MRRFGLACLLMSCFVTAAFGQDWTEFRGPTGQGIFSKGSLPTEWSDTKNVVWKQPIAGAGWSSPILLAGRIYLTTSVPTEDGKKDLSLRAVCLDAKSGKPIWDQEVFRPDAKQVVKIHGKNNHASPTPLTDGKRLYVHFGHLGTAALDLDGKILWKKTMSYQPVHGAGGSPILTDDAVVFSCDGGNQQFVVALDRATGNELWKTPRKATSERKFAFSTPLLITVGGQAQIISPGAGAVCAYDPKTGNEIWRVRYAEGYSVIPRPVFGHGLLFLSSGYNSPVIYAIRPDGKGDVTDTHVAWKLLKGAPHTPSLLLVGDELYAVSDNGLASCIDAKTGKPHWQERVEGGYSASPLYADGKVYFQNEAGLGTVVKASKQFEKLADNNLRERTLASYAAADGALFIRTLKHLYRIQSR